MDDDDKLDIPEFLRVQNRSTRPVTVSKPKPPPKPPPVVAPAVEPNPVAEQLFVRKRNKTATRLGRMKENLAYKSIPTAYREWDHRHSRWVDSRVAYQQKLIAAKQRLGITENEMEKLTILTYHNDFVVERGRTTIAADAADFEIQARVVKSANRAGLKKIDRVDVINPDGEIRETWTLDLPNKTLENAQGLKLSLVTETSSTTENTDMATKAKKTATPRKKKANGNGHATAPKGTGIIATIVETIKRDRGANKDEVMAVLTKKFPDRKAESMLSTVKIQINKNAKKKDRDDKRGLVYYG